MSRLSWIVESDWTARANPAVSMSSPSLTTRMKSKGVPAFDEPTIRANAWADRSTVVTWTPHPERCTRSDSAASGSDERTRARRSTSAAAGAASSSCLLCFVSSTVNQNVLPRPGSLRTPIVPPIISTISFEIVVPSPVPPNRRVIDSSACVNRSKMRRCASAEMPMPVSSTSKRIVACLGVSDSRVTRTPTSPLSVNFNGVPEEVQQHLPEQKRIPAQEKRHAGGNAQEGGEPLEPRLGLDDGDRVLQHRVQVEVRHLDGNFPGLDLREVEDILHQEQEGVRRVVDRLRQFLLFRR